MSVRRLAEDTLQPKTFSFNAEKSAEAEKWIAKYPQGRQQSAVIPLLMLAQEQEGWVTRSAIEGIAEKLSMPLIRVMEVATFYTQFMLQPVGTKAHVQVCGTTPCMLRGSEDLMAVCRKKINAQQFKRNDSGTLSWEEVECQGTCVNAPMVMIGRDTYEDLTPERLEEIIDAFEAGNGADITPGPQIDRIFSAAEGGPTTLQSEGNQTARKKPLDKPKKGGKPLSVMQTVDATKAVLPKKQKPKQDIEAGVNPTMQLAATASGRAKSSSKSKTIVSDEDIKNDIKQPKTIEKPTNPDDLKMISGIGPKIEGILHELGIWTWSQIAEWTKDECEWINGYLRFKGRIERENWVEQASALDAGGREEYVKRFGKEPR